MLVFKNINVGPPGRFRYYQPETDRTFENYRTFRSLLNEVIAHRKANNLPIGTEIDKELQNWICMELEQEDAERLCRDSEGARVLARPGSAHYNTGWNGRAKWAELHQYALRTDVTAAGRSVWLQSFEASLPCGGCKRGWKQQMLRNPLPFNATQEEFFNWTVERHNDVNAALGKPTMNLDQARIIWTKTITHHA